MSPAQKLDRIGPLETDSTSILFVTMILTTAEVWNSTDRDMWQTALEEYWKNLKPEEKQFTREMEAVRLAEIQRYDPDEWWNYLLHQYFRWKYTAKNRYATTTQQLQKCATADGRARLHAIKGRLFSFDRSDVREGLRIAGEVPGLGTAGASGLLALLFPEHFGTVDQFAVKALLKVPDLPERERIRRMVPKREDQSINLNDSQGTLLVEIMKKKAKENNRVTNSGFWTPRMVDMFLWAFGHNEYR